MAKAAALIGALGVFITLHAHAQSAPGASAFPVRPIRLVVPTAAGGGVDTAARIVGQALTETWGQQVVVDNRAGGSGIIGSEIVARAAGDGYTLLVAPTTFSTSKSLFKKLPFDPVRDFTPVSLISNEPNILVVHPSLAVQSVKELIALAKSQPDRLNYGYGGIGSTASLSGALFRLKTGVNMTGVSYKGNGPAVNALLAGETQVMFVGLPPTLSFIKSGKLRALAVTSRVRSPFLPGAPTVIEADVPDYEVTNWIGVLAPSSTPRAVIQKLNGELVRLLASPSVKERFAFHGVVPDSTTPEEFAKFLDAELNRWAQVIKAAGIRNN